MSQRQRENNALSQLEAAHRACNDLVSPILGVVYLEKNAQLNSITPDKLSDRSNAQSGTDALLAKLKENPKQYRTLAHAWQKNGHDCLTRTSAMQLLKNWATLGNAAWAARGRLTSVQDLFFEVATEYWLLPGEYREGSSHQSVNGIAWRIIHDLDDTLREVYGREKNISESGSCYCWDYGQRGRVFTFVHTLETFADMLSLIPARPLMYKFAQYLKAIHSWRVRLNLRVEYLRARRLTMTTETSSEPETRKSAAIAVPVLSNRSIPMTRARMAALISGKDGIRSRKYTDLLRAWDWHPISGKKGSRLGTVDLDLVPGALRIKLTAPDQ